MTFAQPFWLLLLLLIPLLALQYRRMSNKRHVTLQVSRMNAMRGVKTWVVYARSWLQALRWGAIGLIVLAMARPQRLWHEEKIETEAIDIMLVVDISPSMLTRDFLPDRLSVAKQMAADFVGKRLYDRIGLVVFSGGAFTQCPLTRDRRVLHAFLHNLRVGELPDGTAIGMGLATAVDRLKDSPSKSKVVVLLTDGEQNAGDLGPLQSAAIAKALGVRVYAIGLGTDGTAAAPVRRNTNGTFAFAVQRTTFDSQLLVQMAEHTGGKFYRAQSPDDLKGIYQEIDRLETSKTTTVALRRVSDLFYWFLNVAFCLLVLELLLRWGALRVITV